MWKDHEIYTATLNALKRELGPMGRKVGVTVADGVVTLVGYVTKTEQKVAAQQAVGAIRGVRAVAAGLHVMGEPTHPLSDTMIAHAIVKALDTVSGRPGHVTVRVEHGWVMLGGAVSTAAAYEKVERALECVPGVRGITSEVKVTEGGILV